jgi:stearoyl-CoA desaturase (delta-9 desaturase)
MSHIAFIKKPIARVSGSSTDSFRPNWLNLSFLIPVHSAGLILWPLYLAMGGDIQWQEIAVMIFMFAMGVIGINVGYHRALAHRSFKMSPVLKFLALLGGASTMEGSVLTWCSDHRRHHKFEDTAQDPYNINRGFWWAHMGWIIGAPTSTDFSNVPDLAKDPMVRNQYKYQGIWIIGAAFGMPLLLGFLLGRLLPCFLLGGLTRLFLLNHFTYLINSYAHYFGRRPYSTLITARDSFICALLAQGEGWHNFHHRFPFDYRNGHRWYHYDPTKWFIQLGKFVGLTSDLKETPAVEIYRARLQVQYASHPELSAIQNHKTHPLTERLEHAFENWHKQSMEWEQAWKQLKVDWSREKSKHVKAMKFKMLEAKRDFKQRYYECRRSLFCARGIKEISPNS